MSDLEIKFNLQWKTFTAGKFNLDDLDKPIADLEKEISEDRVKLINCSDLTLLPILKQQKEHKASQLADRKKNLPKLKEYILLRDKEKCKEVYFTHSEKDAEFIAMNEMKKQGYILIE